MNKENQNAKSIQLFPINHRLFVCVLLFIFIFSIRFFFILETKDVPAFRTPTPGMDIELQWQSARLLVAGADTREPYFELMMCSTPLLQYWHALWQLMIGDNMLHHRILNAVLSALTAVLLFSLMARLTDSYAAGVVSILLWALLPSLIYFDTTLHKSVLEIFFLCILFNIVLGRYGIFERLKPALRGVMTGVLLSVMVLLQINTFLYLIVVVSYFGLATHLYAREKLVLSISTCLIFFAILMTIHYWNQSIKDQYPWFLPVKGVHFYIGFHQGANGMYHSLDNIPSWPYGHTFYTRMAAEVEEKKNLTPMEADRIFINKSLEFILDNPVRTVELLLVKTRLFFNNHEIKSVDDLSYLKQHSKILRLTPVGLGLLVVFSGLGIIYLIQHKKYGVLFFVGGFLLVVLASNILSFVTWRYRLNNTVPLTIFTAFGMIYLKNETKELLFKSKKKLGSRIFIFVCMVILPVTISSVITYYPTMETTKKKHYKRAADNANLSIKAEMMIKRLYSLEHNGANNAYHMVGKALLLNKLHRHSHAFKLLKKIHDDPFYSLYSAEAAYKYVMYLMWLGEYDTAVEVLNNVCLKKPNLYEKIKLKFKRVEKMVFALFIEPNVSF
jgi:tetratricopeptide (TPR) repeat protein